MIGAFNDEKKANSFLAEFQEARRAMTEKKKANKLSLVSCARE
jgi:hypothetical protein